MPTDPPPLDLLIVGGLTIDRFADGTSAAGGTVMHATRNASAAGIRVGVMTVSGTEPEASAAIDELRRTTAWLSCAPASRTTTFRHREVGGRRRLSLDSLGGSVEAPPDPREFPRPAAVLVAPIAGEVPDQMARMWSWPVRRGAILQGWLRTLALGQVKALPLAAIALETRHILGAFDVLIASRPDLSAEKGAPHTLIERLRKTFGPQPMLVVTDGEHGAWLGRGAAAGRKDAAPIHFPAPYVVSGKPTIGAGDLFAARLLADPDWTLDTFPAAMERAMLRVAEELERRPAI